MRPIRLEMASFKFLKEIMTNGICIISKLAIVNYNSKPALYPFIPNDGQTLESLFRKGNAR
jgi:hypothetical protein